MSRRASRGEQQITAIAIVDAAAAAIVAVLGHPVIAIVVLTAAVVLALTVLRRQLRRDANP